VKRDGPVGPAGYHALPASDFDELARGEGGPAVVKRLLTSEYSRRLALLKVLLDLATDSPELLGPLPSAEMAWQALEALGAGKDSASVLRDVMLHPQLGVWLSYTIRAIRSGPSQTPVPLWPQVGQLHSVAFAAAVRSRQIASAQLPARDGAVLLPTLGLARFPHLQRTAVVTAFTAGGNATLRADGREVVLPADWRSDAPGWWGLREVEVRAEGNTLRLYLDDIDPFRDLADPVPPLRLSGADLDRWRGLMDEAWQILNSCVPEAAAAMRVGLKSLAPLEDSAAGMTRSASTGDGFGAILTSRPPTGVWLAEALVHEFQHTKLGGLLHLRDLVVENGSALYYAPWRDDARPVAGLLQGVYAFLGIASFWRSRCLKEPTPADQFEFAYTRRQTWTGLYALARADALTPLGRRFVDRLLGRLRPWMSEPVPVTAARGSWYALNDHRIGWRIRNLPVDPHQLCDLAEGWLRAYPENAHDEPTKGAQPMPHPWSRRRLGLLREHAADSDGFASLASDPDVDLIRGDAASALNFYRTRVRQNVDDDDAWAGLALASVNGSRRLPWRSLLRRPELVKGVCVRLRQLHAAADPIAVAAWCDGMRP
jgi:HEXXH motif-containing protein